VRRHTRRFWVVFIATGLVCCGGCRTSDVSQRNTVLPPGVALQDRTFHSEALGGDATYRIVRSSSLSDGHPVRVLYLLHGNGGDFREWTTSSSIAQLALQGFVLVMPEGHSSYFMNPASGHGGRYEDFITRDLRENAERGLQVVSGKRPRAIVGVSMGGFAAIVIGLKHPDLYGFVGAMSPPVDYPRRRFTLRRWSQSMGIRSIFGPDGSASRSVNDPFVLARKADIDTSPFFFLSVGDGEILREPVMRFESLLRTKGLAHEFHVGSGGHDWQQWNSELPQLIASLRSRD
jgi:putative tributyrin esterase